MIPQTWAIINEQQNKIPLRLILFPLHTPQSNYP